MMAWEFQTDRDLRSAARSLAREHEHLTRDLLTTMDLFEKVQAGRLRVDPQQARRALADHLEVSAKRRDVALCNLLGAVTAKPRPVKPRAVKATAAPVNADGDLIRVRERLAGVNAERDELLMQRSAVFRAMRLAGHSHGRIARSAGCSPQYVAKVLRQGAGEVERQTHQAPSTRPSEQEIEAVMGAARGSTV